MPQRLEFIANKVLRITVPPAIGGGMVSSALEVSHFMLYINLRLTNLLTYLLTYSRWCLILDPEDADSIPGRLLY